MENGNWWPSWQPYLIIFNVIALKPSLMNSLSPKTLKTRYQLMKYENYTHENLLTITIGSHFGSHLEMFQSNDFEIIINEFLDPKNP